MIDRGFAANCGIDLCQERGRNLNIRRAALIACCSEARHIANHTTTQGNQRRLAFASFSDELIKNEIKCLPVLVIFAVRQYDFKTLYSDGRQRIPEPFSVKRGSRRVGNDGNALLQKMRHDQVGTIDEPRSDVDRVGLIFDIYGKGTH